MFTVRELYTRTTNWWWKASLIYFSNEFIAHLPRACTFSYTCTQRARRHQKKRTINSRCSGKLTWNMNKTSMIGIGCENMTQPKCLAFLLHIRSSANAWYSTILCILIWKALHSNEKNFSAMLSRVHPVSSFLVHPPLRIASLLDSRYFYYMRNHGCSLLLK